LIVYKRALRRKVYRVFRPRTTYRATIRMCSPHRLCLRRAWPRGQTRPEIPAKSRQHQRAIQSFPKPVSRSVRSVHSVRRGHAARGGQECRESLPEARAAKHFAETCGRSGRSGRGQVNDSRRVQSGMNGKREECWRNAPSALYPVLYGHSHKSAMVDSTRTRPANPTATEGCPMTVGPVRASSRCVAHAPMEKVPDWCLEPSARGPYLQ
jgi:hypothetical protein